MKNPLCQYKDLFGKPRDGLRKYRMFDIAILDTAVVIIIGLIFSWVTKVNIWLTLAVLFLSGIVVHRLFCVKTGLDKKIFG
jgi:hypothetical protein